MEDLTGKKFNRLTVISFATKRKNRNYWFCKCECGKEKEVESSDLKRGRVKSCGCLQKERYYESITNTRLYNIWRGMKSRCLNPNRKQYIYYGGRGIKVCDEWRENSKKFYEWALKNGYNEELTLDRIDHNGDYSPENCRWVSQDIQANNKRKKIYYFDGHVYYAEDLAEILETSVNVVKRKYRSIAYG